MPVETANYISDLVPTNPQLGDNIADGPNHFWLIKKAIQNTFPNIKGAITASQDQLNTLTGLVGSSTSDGLDLKGNLTVEGNLTVSNGVDLKGNLTVEGKALVPSVTDWTQKQAVPASDADARYAPLSMMPFTDTKLRFQVIQATVGYQTLVKWPKAFASDPVFITACAIDDTTLYPKGVFIRDMDETGALFYAYDFPPPGNGVNYWDGTDYRYTELVVYIMVGGYF